MLIGVKLRQICRDYLRDRIFILALVSILFVMGTIFGVVSSGMLNSAQRQELVSFINQGLHEDLRVQNNGFLQQKLFANIQTVFFLFFMGVSVIGVPLALLLIFTRGFILGYSCGFLFQSLGLKGALITLVGVLPHNLLAIPALFLMAIAIIDCAAALTKIRFTKKPVLIRTELIKCAAITAVVLVVMCLSAVVEGVLTPWITSWLAPII